MASTFTPWLENTIATELRCADVWLRKKYKNKILGVKSERFAGIYEDNGSCVEIIVKSDLDTKHESRVQIAQVAPLVLSDGETSIEATLSEACQQHLSTRYSEDITTQALNDHIVLRRYTIRHTTLGPPRQQLCLILDEIDWPGVTGHPFQTSPKPLQTQALVTTSLRRLHDTRAEANLKYGKPDAPSDNMNASKGSGDDKSMADTTFESQAAFGTQMVQPVSKATKKKYTLEKHPPNVSSLLNLINKPSGAQKAAPAIVPASKGGLGSRKPNHDKPSAGIDSANTFSPVRLDGMNPTQPSIVKDRPTTSEHAEPAAQDNAESASLWTDGCISYQGNLADVPLDQRALLTSAGAWYKPESGGRVSGCNIPVQLFKLLGERAREETTDSNDDDQDVDMDMGEEADFQDDDQPQSSGTPIPWSPSPTPEPPKAIAVNNSVLPPDSSFEPTGREVEALPPSSPPAVEAHDDSDEEMETDVPQALGEDHYGALHHSNGMGIAHRPSTSVAASKSVVQVKETPHPKEKRQNHAESPHAQTSPGVLKDTSSTSIIHATYKEPVASKPAGGAVATTGDSHTRKDQEAATEDVSMTDAGLEGDTTLVSSLPSPSNPNAPAMSTQLPRATKALPPEETPAFARPPATKRGLEASPTKNRGQAPPKKQRGIKIVKYGDDSESRVDSTLSPPNAIWQQARREAMEQGRIEREATRAASGVKPPQTRTASAGEVFQDEYREEMGELPPGIGDRPPAVQVPLQDANSPKAPSSVSAYTTVNNTSFRSARAPNSPTTTNDTKSGADADVAMSDMPLTVFGTFKATYPQYTGDQKHFAALLMQIHKLEMEDKMVAKYQWDDYIIRNRVDYKDYVNACLDEGNEVDPYIRFYKDQLDTIMYQKGVVKNKATLLKALEELEAKTPVVRPEYAQPVATPEARAGRRPQYSTPTRSDPTRSDQVMAPTPQYLKKVPGRKIAARRSPAPGSDGYSDSAGDKPSRPQAVSSKSITREAPTRTPPSTGNPFRDFAIAHNVVLSHTGDSSATNEKWPLNVSGRRSVRTVTKKTGGLDVLGWKGDMV